MGFRKWWFLSIEEISLLERHWKLGMMNLIHNLLQLYKCFSFLSYLMITVMGYLVN